MKFYNTPEIETLKFAIANSAICDTSYPFDDGGVGNGDGTGVDDEDVFGEN